MGSTTNEEAGSMRARTAGVLLVVAGIVLAASFAGADEQPAPYLLDAEDVLSVVVVNHPELSVDALMVLSDGTIDYPLVGKVAARGLTPDQLQDRIAEGLRKELKNPKVTVAVKIPRPRRVYVNGEVGKAGIVEWKPGWRISEAIAAAGGLVARPDLAEAKIFRVGHDPIVVDLAAVYVQAEPGANVPVLVEDSITVYSRTLRIYVTGQVRQPGYFYIPIGTGIREAIATAGGLSEKAAPTRAYIQRGTQQIPVDLHRLIEQADASADVPLQANDVLHVPEARDFIAVFGHVTNPGYYPLNEVDRLTVARAIGVAGGSDANAKLTDVILVRAEQGATKTQTVNVRAILEQGQVQRDIVLKPGDIIVVSGKERKTTRNILSQLYGLGALRVLIGF
jgi:polysaccharide export outer membrane protein